MRRILLRLRGSGRALKPSARAGGAAIAGRHGNKFHKVESDIFVAARSCACALCFVHENLSVNTRMNSDDSKAVGRQLLGLALSHLRETRKRSDGAKSLKAGSCSRKPIIIM